MQSVTTRVPLANITNTTPVSSDVEVDPQMVARYLQYECRYRQCKYRDADIKTWGELVRDDYPHFVFLMSTEVAVDSNTFLALSSQMSPVDREMALNCIRRSDTKEGKENIGADFLKLVCSHRGRMHGLTWDAIRAKDYSYFVWAVGNTMGRDTKSFNVFFECLHKKEQQLVLAMAKGQVKVPKGLRF